MTRKPNTRIYTDVRDRVRSAYTDDLALPPENLQGMDKVIDDLTLVEIPDCAHFVTWSAPEAVNDAIDGFLAQTS